MTLYDSVKKLADERGLSIAKLERESGIANGVIHRWERGANVLTVAKVAKYLGVKIEDLLKGV